MICSFLRSFPDIVSSLSFPDELVFLSFSLRKTEEEKEVVPSRPSSCSQGTEGRGEMRKMKGKEDFSPDVSGETLLVFVYPFRISDIPVSFLLELHCICECEKSENYDDDTEDEDIHAESVGFICRCCDI